jgi:PKD repeat protein
MKKEVVIGIILLLVVIIGFIYFLEQPLLSPPSFQVGNKSFELSESYGPSQNITGWINISFSEYSSDALFEDSNEAKISLYELLNSETNSDYDCVPSNCEKAYSILNPEAEKSFSLDSREDKLIGFVFTGDLSDTSITFNDFVIESDAEENCNNQIKIDFFDDGSYEKGNSNSGIGNCDFFKSYGCFDSNEQTEPKFIGTTPFCQRITLAEAPGFKIGAWVKKSGNAELKMFLKNSYGEIVEGSVCDLPEALVNGGEIECEIDFLITEPTEYYVCIASKSGEDYSTQGYLTSEGCGFYGEGIQDEDFAYRIFVENRKFARVDNLTIENSLPNEGSLSVLMEDYISGEDCSSGCIVPIRIRSGTDQNIILKDLNLRYNKGGPTAVTDFYDLEESSPKISSNFGKLYLDNSGFVSSNSYGNFTFELNLGNQEILSTKLRVEKIPVINGLNPTNTVSALPTEFEIDANASSSIEKYYWYFGDGEEETSSNNKVVHAYNSTGTYELKIEVEDSTGRIARRTFLISVGNPKTIISKMFDEKNNDISNVKEDLANLSSFQESHLTTTLDLQKIGNDLKALEREFAAAYSEVEYNNILTELWNIKIPKSIEVTKIGKDISFYPQKSLINVDYLAQIEQANLEESDSVYQDAVLEWYQTNVDIEISFTEFRANYEFISETLGNFYEIILTRKNSINYDSYLIIENLEGLTFKENYLQNPETGFTYLELKQDHQEVGFFTSESIAFNEIPLFVSPGISRLSIVKINEGEGAEVNTFLMGLIIFLVLIFGIVVYIILQEWYKKKYEKHLFETPTKLYNLVNFIQNSKKKGLKEGDIARELKKSGWNYEQINYALKKYEGKRTGMVEIPINKILGKLRKKGIDVPKPTQEKAIQIPPRAPIPKRMLPRGIIRRDRKMFFKK